MPLPTLLKDLGDWLGFVAAVATAFGIVKLVGSWIAATVGRQWQLRRQIEKLAPGMRSEAFRERLGVPEFGDETRQTWVFPECFVHVAIESERVTAMAVTLRRPWFRVAVPRDDARLLLGKATFAAVQEGVGRKAVIGAQGANRWGYSELTPSASVTNFQDFAVSINDAGVVFEEDAWELARAADGGQIKVVRDLRKHVRFNTYAVSAPGASVESIADGPSYGVSVYTARLAPSSRPRWLSLPLVRKTPWADSFAIGK